MQEWQQALAYDIALAREDAGEPIETLKEKYALTYASLEALQTDPEFKRSIALAQSHIKENNISFVKRAQIYVEAWLTDMDAIVRDADASPSARVDLFKHMTNISGYVPKNSVANGEMSIGDKVAIHFHFKGEDDSDTRLNESCIRENTELAISGERIS